MGFLVLAAGKMVQPQAGQIVLMGLLQRRVEILADADAAYSTVAGPQDARDEMIDPFVVEAHAVDQRALLRNSEHARLRIPRLRPRCHRAQFDVAEAQCTQSIQVVAVLIEAGCQSQGMREVQTETTYGDFFGNPRRRPDRPQPAQCRKSCVVRELRPQAREYRQRALGDGAYCAPHT